MTRLNFSKAREESPDEDLHLLECLAREEMDGQGIEVARAALKEAEEKGTVPLRDLMRELGD
jgi:hypothetical protein